MYTKRCACLVLFALVVGQLLASTADAKRRKIRNVYDLEEDVGWTGMSLTFAMVKEGTAFGQWMATSYHPFKHWAMGGAWSYLATPEDGMLVGNLIAWTGVGFGKHVGDGLGAWIDLDFHVSLSPVGWGGEGRQRAAALDWATDNTRTHSSPGAYALDAELSAGVFMSQTSFYIEVQPEMIRPYSESAEREIRTGLSYSAGLAFGFGDHRGAYGIHLGCYGYKEFTGEAENAFGLSGSIWLRFGSLGIRPYLGASAPVVGYGPQLIAEVFTGVSWTFDLRLPKKDRRDPLPPSPTTALRPMRP